MVAADDLERVRALQNGFVLASVGQVNHDIRADVDGRNSSEGAGTESVVNATDFETLRIQQNAFILGSTQTFGVSRAAIGFDEPDEHAIAPATVPAAEPLDRSNARASSIDHVFASVIDMTEQSTATRMNSRDSIARLTSTLRETASSAWTRWTDQTVDEVFADDMSGTIKLPSLNHRSRRQIWR
jgi:hypothetical protein